jgi:hypothetical protein
MKLYYWNFQISKERERCLHTQKKRNMEIEVLTEEGNM